MKISYSQLKKLSVETKSGSTLGHVGDIIIDVDQQAIAQYEVKSSMLATKKYMIHQEQVISISAEKIIVDDAVVGQQEDRLKMPGSDVGQEPVAMRDQT